VLPRRSHAWALLALALAALLTAASASASPVIGPEGSAFYTPPTSSPKGSAGELVWYRPATLNLKVPLPGNKAWTVLYQSTDQRGNPDFVTGTVIVPTSTWRGRGTRPVVTIGIGTQGIAPQCAPSKQMITGSEYAAGEIIAALRAGYAVDVTDYQGYTNGAIPTYTAGRAEGQAVLDIVRAGRQLPGSGLSERNPTYAWGYSQGGQAVSWAGELQSSYASNVKLSGIAAGGVPANLREFGAFSGPSTSSALGILSAIGLEAAYPELKLGTLTPAGEEAVAAALSECVTELLTTLKGADFQEYTTEHKTLQELEEGEPNFRKALEDQNLDNKAVSAPAYHYHGLEDEMVPISQDVNLHYHWCTLGVKDDMQLYDAEHLFTAAMAANTALQWIEERVSGRSAPSTCGRHTTGATLPANARLTPEIGGLIVKLNEWSLSGKVTEKSGLSQEVPRGATISSTADATSGSLEATLHIPPMNQTFWVGLLPVTVSGSLTPTGPAEGTFGFSADGSEVFESADGKANEEVKAVSIGWLYLPLGCRTLEPIDLPLSIKEPTNALSSAGSFSFSAEVTVPDFGECGLLGPIISSTTSGPGSKVEMTARPPAPISW
jgi:Secretory lipase